MEIILYLLAAFGLAFLIKESDGPWGLMAKLRNVLMRNKYVGVFFYKLLDCYFCVGCHTGWIIYLLSTKKDNWSISSCILWIFASGAFSLIVNFVFTNFSKNE